MLDTRAIAIEMAKVLDEYGWNVQECKVVCPNCDRQFVNESEFRFCPVCRTKLTASELEQDGIQQLEEALSTAMEKVASRKPCRRRSKK